MHADEPLIVTQDQLYKMFAKIKKNIDKVPETYPTVEYMDRLIYGGDWKEDFDTYIIENNWQQQKFFTDKTRRTDVFSFIIINLLYGFNKDEQWHMEYPGHKSVTDENLFMYLMNPCHTSYLTSPHVGIWEKSASDNEKADIQAGFEYMQGFLIDEEYFKIVKSEQ